MSEALKDLLHQQATSVAFRPPDLETIAHAGDRRIRRRRTATILAAVSAVVVVVLGGVVALRNVPGGPPPMPAGPWPSSAVTWAFDTTIYVATDAGTDTVEVGHDVRSFVRTATGFVVLDETDAVYSVTGLGVTRIGQMHDTQPNNTDQQRLVVNSRGTLVGWVDEAASPGSLVLRIYDARSGLSRDIPGGPVSEDGVNFFAMDDRTAYWRMPDGLHEVNVDTGDDRLILARAACPSRTRSSRSRSTAWRTVCWPSAPTTTGPSSPGARSRTRASCSTSATAGRPTATPIRCGSRRPGRG